MKQIKFLLLAAILPLFLLNSCNKDDDNNGSSNATKVAYIVNYGSYSGSKGDISTYDINTKTISQDSYKNANALAFNSNIQSMSIYNDLAYLMSNNGDKIDIIDAKTLKQTINPISTNIVKPRYFAATGNTAYVSCWGDVSDWMALPESYIAKIDLATKAVTKIALPGGPEGVLIYNNKLYAALSAINKVAVIDLTSNAISYIQVQAVPQHFVIDANNTIWVSLVSKYSTPFTAEKLGLAQINPTNNTVISTVKFTGMGADGYIHISGDKKTIYAMGSEDYPGTASTIFKLDIATKTLSGTALISGENFYGFNVNPETDQVYVLVSPDATKNGLLKIYDKTGLKMDEKATGISPAHVVFYDIK